VMEVFGAPGIGSGQHDGASSGQTGQPRDLRACAQGCLAWLEADYVRMVHSALRCIVCK